VWLESNCLGAQVRENLSPEQVDEGAFLRDQKGVNKEGTSFWSSQDSAAAVLQEKRSPILNYECAAALIKYSISSLSRLRDFTSRSVNDHRRRRRWCASSRFYFSIGDDAQVKVLPDSCALLITPFERMRTFIAKKRFVCKYTCRVTQLNEYSQLQLDFTLALDDSNYLK
jgi:hypothetical protein